MFNVPKVNTKMHGLESSTIGKLSRERKRKKKVTICSKEKKMLQYAITAGPF